MLKSLSFALPVRPRRLAGLPRSGPVGRLAPPHGTRLGNISLEAEISAYTAILATPNLTDALRKQNESKLRRATDRKDNLSERGAARTGAPAFLAAVDAEQIASQVTVLTEAQAQVTTRKAVLPA
ncbi:MAG TPA: hypothetical protein VF690_10530 [Hymenobacter sp.]